MNIFILLNLLLLTRLYLLQIQLPNTIIFRIESPEEVLSISEDEVDFSIDVATVDNKVVLGSPVTITVDSIGDGLIDGEYLYV